MSDRKARADKEDDKGSHPQQNEVNLDYSGEVVLTPKATLPKAPERKRIHPRRPLPRVPEAPAKDEDTEDCKR